VSVVRADGAGSVQVPGSLRRQQARLAARLGLLPGAGGRLFHRSALR